MGLRPCYGNTDEPLEAAASGGDHGDLLDPAPECCVFTGNLRGVLMPVVLIKTNLLYDMALTPNLGVEVPIGDRYSVEAGFMRGWWLARNWSFCWQLEAASLEGRYWFNPREERWRYGGWFAGVFAQAGFYDFQLDTYNGLQGEFLMAGGSGGYMRQLGGAWSLEFSLGLGFLVTEYRRYVVVPLRERHALASSGPPIRLIGLPYPLKAGISLQWAINGRVKRRMER
jgi:hypothetical protein